jgi:C1A family cysteine protease
MIFNVCPSKKDDYDFSYKASNVVIKEKVDLREWDSNVESQGNLGSCVANAVTNAYELQQKKENTNNFVDLSRLYVYYHARYIEDTIDEDYGVIYIKSALQGVSMYGVCTEQIWPYKIENYNKQPSPESYADACSRKIVSYNFVETTKDILENLSVHKPVVIGMVVYESFMGVTKENSTVPIPTLDDKNIGGHAVLIVGHSLPEQKFLIKNSFGTNWGDSGYAYLPFEYVEKYAFDRWVFDINNQ